MEITKDSIQNHIPYYLTEKDKVELTRALASLSNCQNYYLNRYPFEILQGDGWTSLELIHFERNERKLVKGILLSNSCDISQENKHEYTPNITFSPIIKLSNFTKILQKNGVREDKILSKVLAIKEQKVTTLFYLPKGANLDEDYIARLDEVYTIPFNSFNNRSDKKKIFTLNQIGFYLFLFKLSVHFCRFHENIARGQSKIACSV